MIVLIFVVFNDYESLTMFLEREQRVPSEISIMVVDNTPVVNRDLNTCELWRSMGVRVFWPAQGNVGYAGAARFAYEADEAVRNAQWVGLANVDLRFDLASVAGALGSAYLADDPVVGVVAPQLINSEGQAAPQRHYKDRPSPAKMRSLARLYRFYPLAVAHRLLADYRRKRSARANGLTDGDRLFAPHGALMFFKDSFVSSTDFMNFPNFLFCEEVFVGVAAQEEGLACVFSDRIQYEHLTHASVGKIPSRLVVSYLREAHDAAAHALERNDQRRCPGTTPRG